MARLLVIGNANADEVVRLDAPLVAGGHVRGRPEGIRLGGGGANAAVALAQAGHAVTLWAALGEDADGAMIRLACRAHGLDDSGLRTVPGGITNRHLVLIGPDGDRTLIARRTLAADAAGSPPDSLTAEGLLVKSFAPSLTPVMAARLARGPVVAHAPPDAGVSGIETWPASVWVTSESEMSPTQRADPLGDAVARGGPGLRWLVITRGADGAEALGRDGVRLTVPAAPAARIVDTTGAGDVFAAGLLHALVSGSHADMGAALRVATAWAAHAIAAEGSVPPPGLPV
jgi:sugar/nucleoside kinase (ribokinase family)